MSANKKIDSSDPQFINRKHLLRLDRMVLAIEDFEFICTTSPDTEQVAFSDAVKRVFSDRYIGKDSRNFRDFNSKVCLSFFNNVTTYIREIFDITGLPLHAWKNRLYRAGDVTLITEQAGERMQVAVYVAKDHKVTFVM